MSAIPEVDVKIMATAMAAGILLDATLIRALLVPAAVHLIGDKVWWPSKLADGPTAPAPERELERV